MKTYVLIAFCFLYPFLVFSEPATERKITISRISHPVKVDGIVDPEEWREIKPIEQFVEIFPIEGKNPDVRTEAYVAYDEENLYVAFRAFDNPKELRYSYTRRDEIFSDDMVGIIFDTYGNTNWGYELFVNPLGIQADLKRTTNDEDATFDIIFHSRARLTDTGYEAEMAIPFKSLRFPSGDIQNWLIFLLRIRPRDSRYQYSYPVIHRDISCFFCQGAVTEGLAGIKPGRNMEIIPAITGNKSGNLYDVNDPATGWEKHPWEGKTSLTAKLNFTSNTSAEITLNPDFSQVESDAAQVDVNSTFALFYPEKRPFFQEGSDIFSSYFNLVYTRRINDPLFATKWIFRKDRWDLAFLSARDRHTLILIPLEEGSRSLVSDDSWSNILRLKKSFGQNSYWGVLISDRRFGKEDAFSTQFSFDLRYFFSDHYRIKFQYAHHFQKEFTDSTSIQEWQNETFGYDGHTVAFDGEHFQGSALYGAFEYSSKRMNWTFAYQGYDPGFRSGNGFIFQNNTRRGTINGNLVFYPENAFLDQIIPSIMLARVWNYSGLIKDEWFSPRLFLLFKGQTELMAGYLWSRERFRSKYFPGIKRFTLEGETRFSDIFQGGFEWESGRSIARTIDDPVLGRMHSIESFARIKLMKRWFFEPSLQYFRLTYPDRNNIIYDGYVFRLKTQYQFSPEIFLRVITEFDKFDSRFSAESLISYQPDPFTMIYLGGRTSYGEYSRPYGWEEVEQQIYFKLQYLWQL